MKRRTFVTMLSALLAIAIVFQVMPENVVKATGLSEEYEVFQEGKTDAAILYELEDRREDAVKHFQMSDGSVMAALYSDTVHKKDADGKLVDLDNTLIENGDAFENADGFFDISFFKKPKSNKMVEISYNGYEISFGIENIKSKELKVKNGAKNNKTSLTQTTSQARYDNAFDGIDLVYDLTGSKLKESIIINEYTGISEFVFVYRFGGLVPVLNDDGSISLLDGETTVLEIEAPFMYDSTGAESDAISVSLTEQGSKYIYALSLDKEWLTAEDRVYPVTVDPTTATNTTDSVVRDTYVNANNPTANRASRDRLLVGVSSPNLDGNLTYGPFYTYIWFNIDGVNLPKGSRVTDARLRLSPHPDEWANYGDIESNTAVAIELYEVESTLVSVEDLNWNNKHLVTLKDLPTDYQCLRTGALSDNDEENYYTWNITSLIDRYYTEKNSGNQGFMPGMMLKYKNESAFVNDFYAGFWSGNRGTESNKPAITISYIDTKGIEGYYDYFASSLDNTGTAYVNSFNGSLNYVNCVLAESGIRLPASVSVYYNSANKAYGFSFDQSLEYVESKNFYAYTDADGTIHYFREHKNGNYIDESGSGLLLTVNSSTATFFYEGQPGTTVFNKIGDRWYISSINDGNNSTLTYHRNGTKVTMIVDGAGREITVSYGTNTVTVTDAANRSTVFTFENNLLKRIDYLNGKYAVLSHTNGLLTKITASTGAEIEYSYDTFDRVASIVESDRGGDLINSYSVDYEHKNTTRITDNFDNELLYQFDYYGKTVSVTDKLGNAIYSAYSNMSPDDTIAQENYYLRNKLLLQSDMQSSVINHLRNANAEQGMTFWTVLSGTCTNDTDEFFGFNALKVVSGETRQSITVEQGKSYTFSAYIKTDASSTAHLKLSGVCATVTSDVISTDGEWERHSVTATAISDGLLSASICAEGTARFDLLQLEEGKAMNRVNLIYNSGFKTGLDSWTRSGSSVKAYTDTAETPNYSPNKNAEKKVLAITGDYATKSYAYQNVYLNVPDTGSLVINGWAKADAAPDNEEYNSGKWFGMYVELTYADINRTTKIIPVEFNTAVRIDGEGSYKPWQYVCAAIPLDSDYVDHLDVLSAKVYLCYNNNINTAYFDNIQLFYEEFGTTYTYDEHGNVVSASDSASQTTDFVSSGKDLSSVSNPDGSGFEYYYNSKKLVEAYKTAEGVAGTYTYDTYGNAIGASVFSDGYSQTVQNDTTYRITAAYGALSGTSNGAMLVEGELENTAEQILITETEYGYHKMSVGDLYFEMNEYSGNVILRGKNHGDGQSWSFVPMGDGSYLIRNKSDPNLTDDKAWYLNDSSTVACEYVTEVQATRWMLHNIDLNASSVVGGNTYNVVSVVSGMLMDSDDLFPFINDYEHDSKHQRFRFVSAGNGYYYILSNLYDGTQCYLYAGNYGRILEETGSYSGNIAAMFSIDGTGSHTIRTYFGEYVYFDSDGEIRYSSDFNEYSPNQYWMLFEVSKVISTSAQYSSAYNGNYLTSQTDALGNTVTYAYNAAIGTLTSTTDPKGNVTSYTYNASEQVTSVTQGNITVNYGYDSNTDQLSTINHNGTVYSFAYDDRGRTVSTNVGSRTLATNTYNTENGLIETVTYGNGEVRSYVYDSQQRVESMLINGTVRYTYIYDNQSKLHSVTDVAQGITYRYLYDFLGRPTQMRASNGFTIKLAYDEFNRTSNVKYQYLDDALNTQWRYGNASVVYGVKYNGIEKISYEYDSLMRRTSTTINTTVPFVTNYGYKSVGNNTSTQLASIWYSNTEAFNYIYDANGNITAITHPAGYEIVHYYYDALNQLVREDNFELNKTVTYTYDNGGNIRSIKEYAYTTGALGAVTNEKTYSYTDASWKDLLTNYNGVSIEYDAIGNPRNWINGESFSWVDGRRLAAVTKGSNTINYVYNEDGIRTSKTINGIRTDYYLNGTAVIMQKTGDNCIWYTYDENGLVSGFRYNGNEYYYFRNGQSDIIGIIDSSGSTIARYTYDSWGNHVSITDGNGNNVANNPNHIANINPFRYREYYYDTETGFYYVSSRYYDPEIGRVLNADNNFSNYNLFMYCGNNPVNRIDPKGEHWYYLWIDDLIEAVDELMASMSNIVYGRAAYERSYYDPKGANDLWNSRPFQDTKPSQEMQIFTEFMYDHDFVADISVSVDTPIKNTYVKVGVSKVLSPNENIDASYVHAGIGVATPSVLPINISYSVGIVKGVNAKEDYAKHFLDIGAGAIYGFDYCWWPNGASAYSFTIGTSYGVYGGYDYYWCLD